MYYDFGNEKERLLEEKALVQQELEELVIIRDGIQFSEEEDQDIVFQISTLESQLERMGQ